MRTCKKCGIEKLESTFYKRDSTCRRCRYLSRKKYGNTHTSAECEVCDSVFKPRSSGHKRCKTCSILTRRLRGGRLYQNIPHSKSASVLVVEWVRKCIKTLHCVYCGVLFSDNTHKILDHIIPVSKGGTSDTSNINICCRKCNASKTDMDLDEWILQCERVCAHVGKGKQKKTP